MAVWVTTDLHGNYDLWEQIKNFLKEDDTLIYLGDAIDRGDRGFEIFMEMLEHPQVVFLKGNHEDMLVKAAREAMDGSYGCSKQRLLASNGGFETLTELLYEDRPEIWISMLAKLPTHTTYTNENGQKIFLCHAGCSLWADEPEVIPDDHDLIWDRVHYISKKSDLMSDTIEVHGHTWVNYIKEDLNMKNTENEFLFYTNNKKICIDLGTFHTSKAGILNLDTFEAVYFNI